MKKLSWLQVSTHFLALIIGIGFGYFTWNNSTKEEKIITPTSQVTQAAPDQLTSKGIDDLTNSTEEDTAVTTISLEESVDEKKEDKEENTVASNTSSPIVDNNLERVKLGISDRKIGEVLSSIAQNLEDKRLSYSSKLMQDCSGIFHQMKDSLQNRLPSLSEGAKYQYPSSKNVRNTRQIADWYYKNNNLLLVHDAMASCNSIRPGSVLFYGKSNKTYKNITIDLLTDRDNNYTSNGAIMHIAVVTTVTTDKEGNVIDYTIMHGRNANNHASRTGSKAVQSTRTEGLPPFGNWSQQLVAIANIATPNS